MWRKRDGKSLKVIMLGILIPLILAGQIASSIGAVHNISVYGDSIIQTDLTNGYNAAAHALDNYFWGIEYRMTTMSMTGIIQRECQTGDFTGTLGILKGLKGANDVITGTVFRSEKGDNLIVANDTDYKSKGMSSVIEDEYYEQTKANESIWVGPYQDKLTGEMTLSEYRTVEDDNGNILGVLGMNINYHDISQFFCEKSFSKTGYSIMLKPDGTILSDQVGMSRVHTKTDNATLLEIAASTEEMTGTIDINGGTYLYKAGPIPRTDWRQVSLISADEHTDVRNHSMQVQMIIMIAVIIVSIVFVWLFISSIIRRLLKIKVAMNEAGKGNLTSSVKLKNDMAQKMDELDVIGDSYNHMLQDFSMTIGETKETLRQLQEQNDALNESFEQLNTSSSDINNTMQQVAVVSEEQARSTTTVVGETDEAVANVNKVMDAQSKNVKETEDSFQNIFGGVDSMDTLLADVEDKNATMVQKKEVIFSSMTELSAGIEETSASTQEVTGSAHKQAEIITNLIVLTDKVSECSDRLSEKLNQFTCK